MTNPNDNVRHWCNLCCAETNHQVAHTHSRNRVHADERGEIHHVEDTDFSLVVCKACEVASLVITTERNYGDEPNDADTTREVHPPPCHRCLPSWFRNVEWPDFKRGRSLAGLLEEVYSSIASGNHRVAMMGARAVMEAALEMKGVSGNNFTEILENAERGQHITPDYKKQLSAAVGMGHAATHRSYIPKTSQLESVLDIIENMLYMFFHAGPASAALSAATPPRAKPAA